MKFFIDSADVNEIKQANERGWVDGVTTNPTLIAKSGRSFEEVIKEICKITKGPVSAEVISLKAEEMYKEGVALAKWADNVVVLIPFAVSFARNLESKKGIWMNTESSFSCILSTSKCSLPLII